MLDLTYLGDPVLFKKTMPLSKKDLESAKVRVFVNEFLKTAESLPAAGLAAPQVNKSFRMFCLILEEEYLTYKLLKTTNKKIKGQLITPDKAFLCVNPEIEKVGTETEYEEEACLSIPYYYGIIERSKTIRLTFQDLDSNSYTIEATGFMARVIQHEFDHVNGILFIDRTRSSKDLFFQRPNTKSKGF